jgi:hypothetical protein
VGLRAVRWQADLHHKRGHAPRSGSSAAARAVLGTIDCPVGSCGLVGSGFSSGGDQRRDDEAAIVLMDDGHGRPWISIVSDAAIGVLSGANTAVETGHQSKSASHGGGTNTELVG